MQNKEQGNAAVAVQLSTEKENDLMIHLDDWWNRKIKPLAGKVDSDDYHREQFATDPGMVWFSNKIPKDSFYYDAVKRSQVVNIPDADKSWGGHGRIGATGTVAWSKSNITFEAIAWRSQDGEYQSVRRIDSEITEVMQ